MGTGSGSGNIGSGSQEQSAPRKRGFFSKLLDRDGDGKTELFGDRNSQNTKVTQGTRETHTETGGGVGVAVTVNNVGTVSAQPSGWFTRRKRETVADSGHEETTDKRTTIASPNLRVEKQRGLLDRSRDDNNVAGAFSGDNQKNFRSKTASDRNGSVIEGDSEGKISRSAIGMSGTFNLHTTTEVRKVEGGTLYVDRSSGTWDKGLLSKEKPITVDGESFRAKDTSRMGVTGSDKFTIRNADTGEVINTLSVTVQRRLDSNGKVVVERTSSLVNGSGRTECSAVDTITIDPNDSTKYKYTHKVNGKDVWRVREAGSGSLDIDSKGNITDSRCGGQFILGAKLGLTVNLGLVGNKTTTPLQIADDGKGNAVLVASADTKHAQASGGLGATVGPFGAGGFVYGQANKAGQATDSADIYIKKHFGTQNWYGGTNIAKTQLALGLEGRSVDGEAKIAFDKNGNVDFKKSGETVKLIGQYYANGGTGAQLDKLVAGVSNKHPSVVEVAHNYNEYFKDKLPTDQQFIGSKSVSSSIMIGGHQVTPEQVSNAVKKMTDKIPDVLPDTPGKQLPDMTVGLTVHRNNWAVRNLTGNEYSVICVDPRDSGTWSKKIGDTAIVTYAITGGVLDIDGHSVNITTSSIKDGQQSASKTQTVNTGSAGNGPDVMNSPIIVRGKKEPEREPEKPNNNSPTPTPNNPTPTPTNPTPTPTPSVVTPTPTPSVIPTPTPPTPITPTPPITPPTPIPPTPPVVPPTPINPSVVPPTIPTPVSQISPVQDVIGAPKPPSAYAIVQSTVKGPTVT